MFSFQMNTHFSQKRFFLPFIIIALISLIISIVAASHTFMFLEKGQKVTSEVMGYIEKGSKNGKKLYTPIFSFKSPEGKTLTAKSSTEHFSGPYQMGDKVDLYVIYDPLEIMIDTFFTKWFIPLLTFVFFLIFGSIGLAPLMVDIFRKNTEKLKETGLHTFAKDLTLKESKLEINGQPGFYLIAQGMNPVTYETMTFKSHRLKDRPLFSKKSTISIYVDRQKPKHYFIDLDSITNP